LLDHRRMTGDIGSIVEDGIAEQNEVRHGKGGEGATERRRRDGVERWVTAYLVLSTEYQVLLYSPPHF
jgi:hypothetical protein